MKYSFMSFSCPDLDLDGMLSLAERFGYDGIEPRIDSGHRHGVEVDSDHAFRREARKRAEERGVAICCVATSCKMVLRETERTLEAIDLAGDVGAGRVRVFGGRIPEGMGRDEAIEVVAESLRSVADHAAERGVVVCLETHDDWCDPEHVAEVMRRADHPSVGVNWDVMHPVRMGFATMEAVFRALEPWIRHLHVHDGSRKTGKLVPIGHGDYDHRRVIELLLSISYDGYISGEWINWEDPYEVHLPRELATLRRYESEVKGGAEGGA